MAYLILVRHGESEWNAKNLWTGLTDIPLSEKGKIEAKEAAQKIKGTNIDISFTSKLTRALETLFIIRNELNIQNLQVIQSEALNERDYGDFTGKNKFEIEKQAGKDKFIKIRRFWDYPIPNGESLKDVYNRVIPYFQNTILPYLKVGKNVLIVAHGNSLRAFAKYLENISDKDISKLEIKLGGVYMYEIDVNGNVAKKEWLSD